jgi:molybdopterin/thiamine biosynthesis adenylyltransferase
VDSVSDRLKVEVETVDGRYHRQELISWWDQSRLSSARVLVVGAGALGNELLKNLALLGVGNVIVVDMDRIENSNLSRCVLFRQRDEGRLKAAVAADAIRELNPELSVGAIIGDVRVDVGLGVFADADVVLGGLDNREARLRINECCWKAGIPFIDGAIEGLMGIMRVFVPPGSACYECTMNARDHELIAARKSCSLLTREQMLEGKVPTTATSASVIAAMQVQEAVKLLHADRLESDFAGKGFVYNGLTHESYVVNYARRECQSHDSYDLAGSLAASATTTFAELLERAAQELTDPVLDLEHEVAVSLDCAPCGLSERVLLLIDRLKTPKAICKTCGSELRPVTRHSLTADDGELLQLTPAQLGLPRFDVVTAREGAKRRLHFRIEADQNVFDQLPSS